MEGCTRTEIQNLLWWLWHKGLLVMLAGEVLSGL